MKKNTVIKMIAVGLACLLLSACASGQTEGDILDEIRSAPVVKLEYSGQADSAPIFADNAGTTESVADMAIQASDLAFQEDWIYRFTYNPAEKVIDGHEIVLLFGASSMSIDGVTYLPEEGAAYDAILEWAAGVYRYFAEQ